MSRIWFLLWPNEPLAQVVVVFIALIFIRGWFEAWRAQRLLAAQRHLLQQFEERLEAGAPFGALCREMGLEAESPLGRRLIAVSRAGPSGMYANEELAAVDQRELEEQIHGARFWAGTCVFVGLIGTIFGLGLAISTIAGAGSDLDSLRRELSVALAGMATGFSCTFYGVLAAVLLGWRVNAYQYHCSRFTNHLDRFFATRILPQLPRPGGISETFVQSLDEAAERLRGVLDPFSERLEEAGGSLAEASGTFAGAVPALDRFEESLRGVAETLERHLPELREKEASSRHQVLTLAQHLTALGERLGEIGDRLDRAVPVAAGQSQAIRDSIGQLATHFAGLSEKVSQAAADQHQAVTLMHQAVTDNPALARSQQVAELLQAASDQIQQNSRLVSEVGGQVTNSMRHLVDHFGGFRGDLQGHLSEDTAIRRREAEELALSLHSLQLIVNHVEGALQDAPAARGELREVTASARDQLHQLSTDGRATLNSLQQAAGALTQASQQLGQVSEELRKRPVAPRRDGPSVPQKPPRKWYQPWKR
jgi:methyl-accepting chemotaxis protein/biopolymer transport protein ExbB/TolQ